MNIKSIKPPTFFHTVRALLALVALQLPVIGYCDSGNGWVKNLFESKGKNMKEIAVKVAELHEDEDINIWGLDFSPDGKYLAATSPNTVSMSSNRVEVQIWDWQNKRIVRTLEKEGNTGLTTEPIRYSPDGRLLVACDDGSGGAVIRIWNTETWAVVHDIKDFNFGSCKAIGFTPDGKSLIGVFERMPTKPGDNLVIYDTSTWQPLWGLRTVPFLLDALAISPDGKFIALGGLLYDLSPTAAGLSVVEATKEMFKRKIQPQIAIVDMAQRTIVHTIQSTEWGRIAWSPEGSYVTAAGGGGVEVFDVHSGKQVAKEPLKSAHMSVRYTQDGKYLLESDMDALGNGLGVRIWDGQHRELLQEIPGNIGSLAASRDGHYFAAGSFKNITVWQLK